MHGSFAIRALGTFEGKQVLWGNLLLDEVWATSPVLYGLASLHLEVSLSIFQFLGVQYQARCSCWRAAALPAAPYLSCSEGASFAAHTIRLGGRRWKRDAAFRRACAVEVWHNVLARGRPLVPPRLVGSCENRPEGRSVR